MGSDCISSRSLLIILLSLFKHNFTMENYLQFGSRNQRRNLCKFRISNHKLEIEQVRYRNIKAKERLCKLCKKDVEDEIHFYYSALIYILLGRLHSQSFIDYILQLKV